MEYLIPHFGETAVLLKAIESVFIADLHAIIYIADDTHSLSIKQKNVHILAGTNKGYAAQVNSLMKCVRGDWVVVMNNDVVLNPKWWILQKKFITKVNKNTALIASKILLPNGKIDSVGDSFSSLGIGYKRLHNLDQKIEPTVPLVSVSGALMVLRKKTWEKLGGFDDVIGSYFEDVDFGIRAIINGWEIRCNKNAIATHHESTSTKENYKLKKAVINSFFVVRKNFNNPIKSVLLRRLKLWWLFQVIIHPGSFRVINSYVKNGMGQYLKEEGKQLSTMPKGRLLSVGRELIKLWRNYRFNSRF